MFYYKSTPNEQWKKNNHLIIGLIIRVGIQKVYSSCGLMFESCGCKYNGHWRFT
jgi:hypothetical protein